MTLNEPLRAQGTHIEGLPEVPAFAVSGTPVDCVRLALGNLFSTPDIVVSGINHGPNLGTDVLYSGTVAAAHEAALLGYQSIAVSCLSYKGENIDTAGRVALLAVEYVVEHPMRFGTLLNVNVPPGTPRGVALTRLGKHRYTEGVIEGTDPRGKKCYWIGGGEPVWQRIPGTDFMAIHDGLVSVTPLQRDMTDLARLEKLRSDAGWELEELP